MNYRETPPSPLLKHLIQSYWVMEGCTPGSVTHTVLPDGCFDIVIDLHEEGESTAVLTGIWDRPVEVRVEEGQRTVGVRFYPAAVDALFTCRVAEYNNTVTPFENSMLKGGTPETLLAIRQLDNPEEIIAFWDCFFVMQALAQNTSRTLFVSETAAGGLTVSEFAAETGLSSRQVARRYRNRLGISPKTHLSILRFIRSRRLLLRQPQLSAADVAAECGYSDQSHFIREFRRFSGFTPSAFIKENPVSDFYNTFMDSDGILEAIQENGGFTDEDELHPPHGGKL